jgi:hypothetical protein
MANPVSVTSVNLKLNVSAARRMGKPAVSKNAMLYWWIALGVAGAAAIGMLIALLAR